MLNLSPSLSPTFLFSFFLFVWQLVQVREHIIAQYWSSQQWFSWSSLCSILSCHYNQSIDRLESTDRSARIERSNAICIAAHRDTRRGAHQLSWTQWCFIAKNTDALSSLWKIGNSIDCHLPRWACAHVFMSASLSLPNSKSLRSKPCHNVSKPFKETMPTKPTVGKRYWRTWKNIQASLTHWQSYWVKHNEISTPYGT